MGAYSSDYFLDGGEIAEIGNRLSFRGTSESSHSGGATRVIP